MKQLQQQLLKSKNTYVLPFPASFVPCLLHTPAKSPRQRRSPGGGTRWTRQGDALGLCGKLEGAGAQAAARRDQQGKTLRGWARPPPGRVTISRPQGRAGQGSNPAAGAGHSRRRPPAVAMGTAAVPDLLGADGLLAGPPAVPSVPGQAGSAAPRPAPLHPRAAAPVRPSPSPTAGAGPGVARGAGREASASARASPAPGPRGCRRARREVGAARAAGKR